MIVQNIEEIIDKQFLHYQHYQGTIFLQFLLYKIALKLAHSKNLIDNIDIYLNEFRTTPKLVKNIIDRENDYKK